MSNKIKAKVLRTFRNKYSKSLHKRGDLIAQSDWGQVSHWGIRTAQTGGNLLCRGSFSRVENVQTGNRFTIEIGNLQVSME